MLRKHPTALHARINTRHHEKRLSAFASSRQKHLKKILTNVRFFLTVNFRKSIPSLAATKHVAEQCLITRENRQNGNEEGSQEGTRKEGSKEGNQEEVTNTGKANGGRQQRPPFCVYRTFATAIRHCPLALRDSPTPCSCRSNSRPARITRDPCRYKTAPARPVPCPSSR